MSSYSRWSVVAAFAGLACGQGGEGQVAPKVTPPPVVAPPTTETPPPPPTPTPVAARPQGFSGARVPDDAPRFVVVAQGQEHGDNRMLMLLEATDGQAFLAAGPLLLRLQADGSFTSEPAWLRGLSDGAGDLDAFDAGMFWWNAVALGGTWPEPAYLVLEQLSSSRAGGQPPQLFRRTGEKWTEVETRKGRLAWYPRSFGPWKDGSLLALKGFLPTYSNDLEEEPAPAEVRAYKSALAREKRLIVLRGEPKAPAFGEREVLAFASLASGQIWALIEEGGRPAVLYHDGTSETTTALPGSGTLDQLGLRATAADRVWAFGRRATEETSGGYLARFDGTAWSEVETNCAGEVRSLSIDADGHAYFVCDVMVGKNSRAVLLRAHGGAIEELPTEAPPGMVIARRADDIWVLTAYGERPQLLHSGTTLAQPFELPNSIAVARSVFEWAEPKPWTGACKFVWIPLAAGSDRAAVEQAIAALASDDFYVDLVDARVQGRVEAGVTINAFAGPSEKMVKSLQAKLGAALATPTCNQRTLAEG